MHIFSLMTRLKQICDHSGLGRDEGGRGSSGKLEVFDEILSEAYLFLRRLEHRIQLVHQRQTQQLPSQEDERERIARSLGFADSDKAAHQTLKETLDTIRDQVHHIYENLFFTP
jgi:glutamine synthetase adenylyltransferase